MVVRYSTPELVGLASVPALDESGSREGLERYRISIEHYRSVRAEGARKAIERFRRYTEELQLSGRIDADLYSVMLQLYHKLINQNYPEAVNSYKEAVTAYQASFPTTKD
ncbi:MAG TPA: hypothetical protein VGV41_12510 [Pseudolabrys sp.]|uniref:hypothetical protein n=1 Tax=Pseudolabrys sp. TaxID=1960880 RepID=UPI002DDD7BE6|nr:hypothetical protein [Pseudolabrys sp.]HEV2629453.1 hypothetical protein [Pseudolabrys sp.]